MGFVRARPALLSGALVALGVVALLLGLDWLEVAAQGGATVAIVDFAFDPARTDVAAGETVTWTNEGAEEHTVTADYSSFTSGALAPGESFSATFAASGSFIYRCRIHPSMTGTVVVNGGVGGASADTAEIEAAPVVGVGTAAPRQAGALALLAGVAAAMLGTVALVLRRV